MDLATMKVAVVTGGAGGMGAATMVRLARDGYRVAGIDRNREGLEAVARTIGSGVLTYAADLTSEEQAREAVRRIENEFGRIDALVNTIGWTDTHTFVSEDSAYWRKIIAVNFESILYVTHATVAGMIERQHGKIVTVTSDAGKVGQSREAVYAGCKGALIAWSKSLAREVARYGINVNCTAPGPTLTPLDESLDQEVIDRIVRNIPFRRRAQPEEQAAAIAFLLSEDAAYITGQVLSVSGGLTMA
jgi:2-hydroxycyclohexanecarboxyl-CoA dehydrogenase